MGNMDTVEFWRNAANVAETMRVSVTRERDELRAECAALRASADGLRDELRAEMAARNTAETALGLLRAENATLRGLVRSLRAEINAEERIARAPVDADHPAAWVGGDGDMEYTRWPQPRE